MQHKLYCFCVSAWQVNTQSTSDLSCPPAEAVAKQLADHASGIAQVVTDVMEIAEAAGIALSS